MNQQTFMQQLEAALGRLSAAERREILADYAEYFRDALADGRSEEEVAASLGDPQRLARELQAKAKLQAWESRRSVGNLFGVIGALAGLGVLNFVLAIPFMFYLWCLTIGFVISGFLLLGGVVLSGLWISNSLFDWPALHPLWQQEQATAWVSQVPLDKLPQLDIRGANGEQVVIHRDASSGLTRIEASDANGAVKLEHRNDGSAGRLVLNDEQGTVTLRDLDGVPSRGALLGVGLGLLLVGGIGVTLAWLLARLTWRLVARFARYQLSLLSSAREV